MRSILPKCIIILILALSPIAAQAVSPQVTATYRQVDSGYRLEFTLVAGDYPVYMWGMERIDLTDLTAFYNWSCGAGPRQTEWWSTSRSYDIQPHSSFTGCGAIFPLLPTDVNYFVKQLGVNPVIYYGTLTPTPVPEPTSLLTLAAGTAGLLIRKRRHNP